MPNEKDARLTSVAAEVKRLRRELSDAEWEDAPNVDSIRRELTHYEDLSRQGVLWEPNF